MKPSPWMYTLAILRTIGETREWNSICTLSTLQRTVASSPCPVFISLHHLSICLSNCSNRWSSSCRNFDGCVVNNFSSSHRCVACFPFLYFFSFLQHIAMQREHENPGDNGFLCDDKHVHTRRTYVASPSFSFSFLSLPLPSLNRTTKWTRKWDTTEL